MIFNQWYAIYPSKNIGSGMLVALRRFGENLVLFRNQEGTLACLQDKCSHRGAQLSKGRVKANCITCPFHGIHFDKTGKAQFIPANGLASTEDISRFNVRSYSIKEVRDIVYCWYGDPEKATGIPPFFYDDISGETIYSEISDLWHAHYSRCIENQLDVVHVPIVHHNTIGRGNKTLVNGPKVRFYHRKLKTSANNAVDIGQTPLPPEECTINPTHLCFQFPNVWMNYISDKLKIMIYFAPVDDQNTILYIRFYTTISHSRYLNRIIATGGKLANRIIERQDKRVVITQQPKVSSYQSEENLLVGDGPIILYRKIRDELKNP